MSLRQIGAIQDLYPDAPVLRYHRIASEIERKFGQTTENPPTLLRNSEFGIRKAEVNWLDIIVAFLLGYLMGGRRYES